MEFNDLIIYIMYSMIQKPELVGIIACFGTIIACIVNILSNKMTKQQFDWVREDRENQETLYKIRSKQILICSKCMENVHNFINHMRQTYELTNEKEIFKNMYFDKEIKIENIEKIIHDKNKELKNSDKELIYCLNNLAKRYPEYFKEIGEKILNKNENKKDLMKLNVDVYNELIYKIEVFFKDLINQRSSIEVKVFLGANKKFLEKNGFIIEK